jgi:hypothetical protein
MTMQFMSVYNPPNAVPIVLEKVQWADSRLNDTWVHTKSFYRMSNESMLVLKGCTPDMCCSRVWPPGYYDQWSPGSLLGEEELLVPDNLGFVSDEDNLAFFGSAGEQWAELGGGW